MPTFVPFTIGFLVNLALTIVIVYGIYYPATPNKNHAFTLIGFNAVVFMMMVVLTSVELGLGTAFGLFALFSILRYRSVTLDTRDMTYLFILIGLPVINAVPLMPGDGFRAIPTVIAGNIALIILLYVLENRRAASKSKGYAPKPKSQKLIYPRNALLRPENYDQLVATLEEETGYSITRVKIEQIDMVQNHAELKLFYLPPDHASTS